MFLVCTVGAALLAVNNAIDSGVTGEILMALQSKGLDLKDVLQEITEYYCDGLVKRKSEKQDVSQTLKKFTPHKTCYITIK